MTKNGLCYQSISKTRFFENSLGIPENSICIQTMYFVLKKQFFDNAQVFSFNIFQLEKNSNTRGKNIYIENINFFLNTVFAHIRRHS